MPPEAAPDAAYHGPGELLSYAVRKDELTDDKIRELIHGYYAATAYVDAQLGRVLAELERLGLAENTIVVLWGDHGFQLGEHGEWARHNNTELSTRIPLIVRTPDISESGASTRALVETVDIYPSLCELAGLPIPSGLEGTSFVPLLADPQRRWKTASFSVWPMRKKSTDGDRTGPILGRAIRKDRHRFVDWDGAFELYDHQTDPDEHVNLVAQPGHTSLVARLRAQLDAGWRAARKGLRARNGDDTAIATLEPQFERDDHDNPAFVFLPDGRLSTFYCRHTKGDMFLRTTMQPGDISNWTPSRQPGFEDRARGPRGVTYANPFLLRDEDDALWLFWRGSDFKPTFSISRDPGATWSPQRTFISENGRGYSNRPYMSYKTFTAHPEFGHTYKPEERLGFTVGAVYQKDLLAFAPFPVRGVLWYQGEGDASRAYLYPDMLKLMIDDWRGALENPELPFLIVQLPPWERRRTDPERTTTGVKWAELREAQASVAKDTPNTYLAVIADLGERLDIHPRRKREAGERLARLARAEVHGETVSAHGPQLISTGIGPESIVLAFSHADGGLFARGGSLRDFEVAGSGGAFVTAAAEITSYNELTIKIPPGMTAQYVRYAWRDHFEPALFNGDGFPASPFRTGDLPFTTIPPDSRPSSPPASPAP
ncbi:MAG: sulfatase-like hydrolase/transferase [Opitutaceae bacterium]